MRVVFHVRMVVVFLDNNPSIRLGNKHTHFVIGTLCSEHLGPSQYKDRLIYMAISMLKIRRPLGRLIFNMGIAIPGKTIFLIETAPWVSCAVTCHESHVMVNTKKLYTV